MGTPDIPKDDPSIVSADLEQLKRTVPQDEALPFGTEEEKALKMERARALVTLIRTYYTSIIAEETPEGMRVRRGPVEESVYDTARKLMDTLDLKLRFLYHKKAD